MVNLWSTPVAALKIWPRNSNTRLKPLTTGVPRPSAT